ncbi:hypothetical protein GCM10020254_21920 [Streptomyces goshikiensis]
MAFAVVFLKEAGGPARWLWIAVGCACLARALLVATRFYEAGGRLFGFSCGCLTALLFLVLAYWAPGWTPAQLLLCAGMAVTPVGIWLLVRQWTTWSEWLTATVPLAVTLATGLVVASGSVLHGLYGDGLDLTQEELDVPGLWQVAAGLKLIAYLALGLLGPALWGDREAPPPRVHPARRVPERDHLRPPLRTGPRLAGGPGRGQRGAGRGPHQGRRRAAPRGAPRTSGVRPEWVCVRPTVPTAELNSEGAWWTRAGRTCPSGRPGTPCCSGTPTPAPRSSSAPTRCVWNPRRIRRGPARDTPWGHGNAPPPGPVGPGGGAGVRPLCVPAESVVPGSGQPTSWS